MKASKGIVNIFRGAARPIISIIAIAVIAQVVVERIAISPGEWALLSGIVLWWFTSRTVEKVKDAKKD